MDANNQGSTRRQNSNLGAKHHGHDKGQKLSNKQIGNQILNSNRILGHHQTHQSQDMSNRADGFKDQDKNINSHRISYDQFTRNQNERNTGSHGAVPYGQGATPGSISQAGRIRGSSSGAFVGENIAGLGAIGKS